MLFYISKVLFVYQQVIIVQKYASINREFSIFFKTVLSHLKNVFVVVVVSAVFEIFLLFVVFGDY
jgi:hypothetical protein